jgi:hypothetical protein
LKGIKVIHVSIAKFLIVRGARGETLGSVQKSLMRYGLARPWSCPDKDDSEPI